MKVDRNSPLERNLSPTQVFHLVMVVGSTFYVSSKPQSSDLQSLHTKLSLRNEDDTQENLKLKGSDSENCEMTGASPPPTGISVSLSGSTIKGADTFTASTCDALCSFIATGIKEGKVGKIPVSTTGARDHQPAVHHEYEA
ncbi:Hypothetical predicted protein [Prunus dulcis]|uniref:Uncharacterized protein n=1 Tax=Prunus dulcis TaxID=3755 RepID=A0A5E4FR53_PRUDU|nr:Hypothetical predicted protein [Prunus dulcis]